MKTDIETLKDSFWLGYDMYQDSRREMSEVTDMYHNRQWSAEHLALLERRGQPKETFNVIKMFARLLVGYYSTVANHIQATPRQDSDITAASVASDLLAYIFNQNNMDIEGDKIKLSAILTGLMCSYTQPVKTGETDQFGRPIYDIEISYVPPTEIVIDPLSTQEDYSDARFMHRFKWMPREAVDTTFGAGSADKLETHYNHLNIDEAEFEYQHVGGFQGRYRVFDNYLVVHTVITDDAGKRWSIFWSGDVELQRDEITYRDMKWNYRVVKLHTSDRVEHYGIFREVVETQKAINQALIKLQLIVNTQKVMVQDGSVDNLAAFEDAFNRVSGVIPVRKLAGIKVENLSRDVLDQYVIIDRALDRIKQVLSISDAFLGKAYAADSGRKVKLQQNSTIMALRYLTTRIELFYKLLGSDVLALIKQYYTANRVVSIVDEITGARFIELNKPMMQWSGQMDAAGEPIHEPIMDLATNPADGEPELTEDGSLIYAPVNEAGSDLALSTLDIVITSIASHDDDERSQLLLETMMSGAIGQMTAQVNPTGFFEMAALLLKTTKTKYSPELADILQRTAASLGGNPEAAQQAQSAGAGLSNQSSQQSKSLKLPANTNEGL